MTMTNRPECWSKRTLGSKAEGAGVPRKVSSGVGPASGLPILSQIWMPLLVTITTRPAPSVPVPTAMCVLAGLWREPSFAVPSTPAKPKATGGVVERVVTVPVVDEDVEELVVVVDEDVGERVVAVDEDVEELVVAVDEEVVERVVVVDEDVVELVVTLVSLSLAMKVPQIEVSTPDVFTTSFAIQKVRSSSGSTTVAEYSPQGLAVENAS